MAGKFLQCHKRCIREEDYKLNNRVIDEELVGPTQVYISLLLIMNRPVNFINRALKKGYPLPTEYVGHVFGEKNQLFLSFCIQCLYT